FRHERPVAAAIVVTVVGGGPRRGLVDALEEVRRVRGEGEADRVGQTLPLKPACEVLGATGSIGADQDLLRPPPAPAQQRRWELGKGLTRHADVIAGGVGAGVAGTEVDRQRLPGPGLAVVQERAQGVVAEAALERRCRLLLLAMDIDQGGVPRHRRCPAARGQRSQQAGLLGRWRGGWCSGPWFYSVIFPPRVGRESMTALMPHRQRSEQRGGSSCRGRRDQPTALRGSAEQRW